MSELEIRPIRTPEDLLAVIAVRAAVFVQEQGFPLVEEFDQHDPAAFHLLALRGDVPVGTGRLIVAGEEGIVGRMAVVAAARRSGVGSALLDGLLDEARRRGLKRVRLSAQLHARPFYARRGFVASGPHYLEGSVPHQRMDLSLA